MERCRAGLVVVLLVVVVMRDRGVLTRASECDQKRVSA